MKYSIDRIENNIAILENLTTKEIIEISIVNLPQAIKEGSILIYDNNQYYIDKDTEEKRREDIKGKFNKLRKKGG